MHDLGSLALAERADRASYDHEVLRHRSELVAAAIRLTGSRAEADDLVQEAVMRAWVFWHRFEPGTNGRAWMHRILLNTFINGYRKRRREREVLTQVHAVESHARRNVELASSTPGEALSDEVHAALSRLPDEFRRVIVLVDLEDRSYRDAAIAMGCPIGTVMSRLHRARKAMQRELASAAASHGYASVDSPQLTACEPTLEAA
ncbi:MAG: sigma-70 family RNA polymerase sigma factor [Sandaracinaceae bacterium]|nr:sigma-70 family RNA polymerase sigma factor [Sandaracinaceae bacterium]